ncbi:unnamed protein product [Lota lota]
MAPKDSLTLLPCFYFVELPIVASSMLSLYLLELTQLLQPAQGGYRCHQPSLSMPYVDPAAELIPLLMLLSLAFAGPAAAIMVGEGLVYSLQLRVSMCNPNPNPGAEGSINAGGWNFNSFLRRIVRFVGVHVFGLCVTALVTDVIQLATGYYAPFFLTVCKPNYTLLSVPCDLNPFINKDICSGHDQQAILTARKTFPSQHATLSAFAAVYVSMYLNSTIPDCTKLVKPVLVFAFCMAAALSGLTQISQHRSHAVDVYTGFLIGAFIAAYLACHAVANFRSSEDLIPSGPAPPDALRALAERGHDSVYNKGPASASESNDQISVAPGPRGEGGPGQPLRRERASVGSLKRASVEVELLAPRSPMGKETMVTFSHTLPRASMSIQEADVPLQPVQVPLQPVQVPLQPVQVPLQPVQVPLQPVRSQELVSVWQQKSMDRKREEDPPSEEGSEVGSGGPDEGLIPVYPPVVRPGRPANPPGARVTVSPKTHIPEARPPAVSPKSALTRAKWLAITEKSSPPSPSSQPRLLQSSSMSSQPRLLQSSSMSSQPRLLQSSSMSSQPRLLQSSSMSSQPRLLQSSSMSSQPRLLQSSSMSTQQGLLQSSSSGETPKSSTAPSPHILPPSRQDRCSIPAVDAPPNPVAHGPSDPWEWRSLATGGDQRD